jgi:hypothetical protein
VAVERVGERGDALRVELDVVVEDEHQRGRRRADAGVDGRREARVPLEGDTADPRVAREEARDRAAARPVVDDDRLEPHGGLRVERAEAAVEADVGVVARDDDGDRR